MTSRIYFDKQDYELLRVVTHTLEQNPGKAAAEPLFCQELHPHGIKELSMSRELRIAHAVINLLHSLEAGQAEDRLEALSSLYDEVVSVTDSSFRYNTGRALIQIMKELVRAHGSPDQQLRLAHDFRKTAGGNRRFVRKMLSTYHLLEMPEEWNQLTFDDHVHDSNTKGRKTPTHLIMDAWIKGIRSVTVIYYNFIEAAAVSELLQAAAIVGITTNVGIEYRAVFRGRYVLFIWEPPAFEDTRALSSFLQEPDVTKLMSDGRMSSMHYSASVLRMLEQYNAALRHTITSALGIEAPSISKEEFLDFVASGQPSLLHLAELIYKNLCQGMSQALADLETKRDLALTNKEKQDIAEKITELQSLYPQALLEKWLITKQSCVPNPTIPASNEHGPDFLRITVEELLLRLYNIRRKSKITLSIAGLSLEDTLELLYNAEGKISHLELYNLKDETAGKMKHCAQVSDLQFAINQGSAVALKRIIMDIIRQYKEKKATDKETRSPSLTEILYNIPKLQSFYRRKSLKTCIGSDSTSRSFQLHGMGFAMVESLPRNAIKTINASEKQRKKVPLEADIESIYTYSPYPHTKKKKENVWLRFLRAIPGFSYAGFQKKHTWNIREATIRYDANADKLITLGGFRNEAPTFFTEKKQPEPCEPLASLGFRYANTKLTNLAKIAAGFFLTLITFSFTQEWWVLAWFGAPIWFAITGIRNIFQAVLAGRGFSQSSLLGWRDYVNWNRISDSLLFTGISVPLLELVIRWGILGKIFSLTSASSPLLFYTIVSTANGIYIAWHNMYRGLQKEAIIGNLFRSVLAVPLALIYNALFVQILYLLSLESALPLLADASAIISKASSDTVAGVIEGIADQRTNLRMRHWDYVRKIKQLFACYAKLDLMLPETDTLALLKKKDPALVSHTTEVQSLEKNILVHSLDLMYFLLYQPRAKTMLESLIDEMTPEERSIFANAQLILTREKEVSQLLVNGDIIQNFSKPLAFYLSRSKGYLETISRLTKVPLELPS